MVDMKQYISELPTAVKGLGIFNMKATEAKRALAKYAGNSSVVQFETMRNKLVEETERLLTQTGAMADSRVQRNLENLRTGYNIKQMESSLNTLNDVINKRLEATKKPIYPNAGGGTSNRPLPKF